MATIKSPRGLLEYFTILLLAWTAWHGPALQARDAFVLLSGGDSPLANNYSQYLQAKAVAANFERNYPRDSVWIFFGAGNIEGEKPVFGDVHRRVKRDGIIVDSWLSGSLSRNRPARRDVFLRALQEEILPAVAGGGTLYLFVGDHGSQTRGENRESIINLWSLERDASNERGWRSTTNESLGVAELRSALAKGIGKGRVVFCMTQCHSGGFHYLAMPREMTPNPQWFTKVPEWAAPKAPLAFPRAAGFTATDELSLAAGCDPDPDPDKWAGYERFVPENLFGADMFTQERTRKPLRSFAEAHEAATLVDRTIDKPYSTSEQYLERWANLIETRLAKETNVTEKIRKQLAIYQRVVDGATAKTSDRAFRERQAQFRRFIERLTEQNASVKSLLFTGTRKELEQAIGPARAPAQIQAQKQSVPGRQNQPQEQPGQKQAQQPQGRGSSPAQPKGQRGRGGASPEMLKLWTETVRPAWKAAVEGNQATGVLAGAMEFEKFLLGQEAKGREYFFARPPAIEIFWRSGYSDPQTVELTKAEAVARWGVERRNKIVAWAKAAPDAAVRAAADKLSQPGPQRRTAPSPVTDPSPQRAPSGQASLSTRLLSKKTAAERTLFYRRVLAAWEFLLAVNERQALDRLRELTELERTPLPRPRNNAAPSAEKTQRSRS